MLSNSSYCFVLHLDKFGLEANVFLEPARDPRLPGTKRSIPSLLPSLAADCSFKIGDRQHKRSSTAPLSPSFH